MKGVAGNRKEMVMEVYTGLVWHMVRYGSEFCKCNRTSSSITEKKCSDISGWQMDQDFSHKEIKAY